MEKFGFVYLWSEVLQHQREGYFLRLVDERNDEG